MSRLERATRLLVILSALAMPLGAHADICQKGSSSRLRVLVQGEKKDFYQVVECKADGSACQPIMPFNHLYPADQVKAAREGKLVNVSVAGAPVSATVDTLAAAFFFFGPKSSNEMVHAAHKVKSPLDAQYFNASTACAYAPSLEKYKSDLADALGQIPKEKVVDLLGQKWDPSPPEPEKAKPAPTPFPTGAMCPAE